MIFQGVIYTVTYLYSNPELCIWWYHKPLFSKLIICLHPGSQPLLLAPLWVSLQTRLVWIPVQVGLALYACKTMNLNAQVWFPHGQGQSLELRILIICPLVNLMLSKISRITTMQRLQQERYAVILWTLFSDILDPTTIFPPHNVWPGHQRLGAVNPKWMESSTEKPTWSVYAGYILSIFCFLFLPNYRRL